MAKETYGLLDDVQRLLRLIFCIGIPGVVFYPREIVKQVVSDSNVHPSFFKKVLNLCHRLALLADMPKKRIDPMKKRVLIQLAFSFFATSLMIGCAAPEQSSSEFTGSFLDLTYAFDDDTIFWPTAPGFKLRTEFKGKTPDGYYYSAYSFSTSEHGGTHLDAPIHFSEGKITADEIPLDQLIGPAIVIDVQEKAIDDPDYLVSIEDFEAWEAVNGRIPEDVIVLVRTGFGAFWPDREKYLGTAELGPEAVPKLHFPGLDPVAATWLATERSIHSIGIDTASIDRGQSTLFESHRALFDNNIPAFENVANMDQLPAKGFTVIALPMKIRGGSGGPLRIVAVLR